VICHPEDLRGWVDRPVFGHVDVQVLADGSEERGDRLAERRGLGEDLHRGVLDDQPAFGSAALSDVAEDDDDARDGPLRTDDRLRLHVGPIAPPALGVLTHLDPHRQAAPDDLPQRLHGSLVAIGTE
jgi:hypothetical protein